MANFLLSTRLKIEVGTTIVVALVCNFPHYQEIWEICDNLPKELQRRIRTRKLESHHTLLLVETYGRRFDEMVMKKLPQMPLVLWK